MPVYFTPPPQQHISPPRAFRAPASGGVPRAGARTAMTWAWRQRASCCAAATAARNRFAPLQNICRSWPAAQHLSFAATVAALPLYVPPPADRAGARVSPQHGALPPPADSYYALSMPPRTVSPCHVNISHITRTGARARTLPWPLPAAALAWPRHRCP